MSKTASNDDAIITALLQHGTIKEAAAAANTTPRTIYNRMNNREFRAQYEAAKNDILRTAYITISGKLTAAIEAVADIMSNPENNPAVRLQAAQTIITNAAKFSERLHTDEYNARQEGKSPFDFDFD
jgi:hypothetical protein